MSVQRQSAVVYDGLPIGSGGAHGLGRISASQALRRWRDFLAACGSPVQPLECSFNIRALSDAQVIDPSVVEAIHSAFPMQGTFVPRNNNFSPVPPDRLDEAVALLESIEPQPADKWGNVPVWLNTHADFHLKTPDGSGLWPGQGTGGFGDFKTPAGVRLGISNGGLNLEARKSIGLMLSVPDATDDDLAVLVPWLQAALPFRMSSKHWTRWSLAKNGRTYRGRRFVPPGL